MQTCGLPQHVHRLGRMENIIRKVQRDTLLLNFPGTTTSTRKLRAYFEALK
jgi:hypothetical protein